MRWDRSLKAGLGAVLGVTDASRRFGGQRPTDAASAQSAVLQDAVCCQKLLTQPRRQLGSMVVLLSHRA